MVERNENGELSASNSKTKGNTSHARSNPGRNQKQSDGGNDSGPQIRKLGTEEIDGAAELVARLKRLNGEFDPLLKTVSSVESEAKKVLEGATQSKNSVVLVAVQGSSKVVGVVKADLVDRAFYEPRKEGAIVEFYILPEFRRGSLGNELLDTMVQNLKERGADLITAEFPSQNEIAKKFYTKLGFRSLTNVYAKSY